MNRHARRRAAKIERHNRFYRNYIQHVPTVPADAPFERGKVYHLVINHDEWCSYYDNGVCNCSPAISRHIEPERS
jgi:hypothetical protein